MNSRTPSTVRRGVALLLMSAVLSAAPMAPALAQATTVPAADACRATGLLALKQHAGDITDLVLDMDSLAVSEADTKVEDVPVKTVVLGEAYIKRGEKTGKPDRFVCLIGDKGKVVLTFFTSK